MPKIPDSDRCQFYSRDPHLVCAVHPHGVEGDRCLDFRPDPQVQDEEQWSPENYFWYDGELIRIQSPRFTAEEQLEILDSHPLFTGICPQCGHRFDRAVPPLMHWVCSVCSWVEDSV